MAQLLRVVRVVESSLRSTRLMSNVNVSALAHSHLLKTCVPLLSSTRNKTFFDRQSADNLWKGVTSVSNAGRRRGRAKGLPRKRDLNKGQVIGEGKILMKFPGLNSPVIIGKQLVKQQKLPPDSEREEKLAKLREIQSGFRRIKLSPLERGWTSAGMGGRKIGPPDPIGEDTFEGFETWILESKLVTCMTGNLGRKSRLSALVVTGNRNGLAGFSLSKAPVAKAALLKAKNRAGQRLIYVPRYQEHTVLHDFYTQFGNTKIFVSKMHEGYGLVCHRVIKCICEAIGIKNLYAKVEGPTNVQHIVKAFFIGLLQQKSHQQLADEKQLHLVEFRSETGNMPTVVASPSKVRKEEEISSDENLDFTRYVLDDRIVLRRKKYTPFYTRLPSFQNHLLKVERRRNFEETRLRLTAKYGALHSFLTEKYPEAKIQERKKIETEES